MKLLLRGHTERYPVEQLQMQLFGNEPSEFVTEEFEEDCPVIATGGLSRVIGQATDVFTAVDVDLTLRGIWRIWQAR